MSASFICLLLAAIFALLLMVNQPSPPRFNWLGACLFFWLLSILLAGVGPHPLLH